MRGLPVLPRWVRVGSVVFVLTVIVYFSFLDTPSPPGTPGPWWDKQLHFAAYGALAVVAVGATAEYRDRGWKRVLGVFAFVVSVGVAVELGQWTLPQRYASVGDVVANVAAPLLGSTVLWLASRLGYGPAGTSPLVESS